MDENALVAAYSATDAVDALLNRSLLEEAGIDVEERLFEADTFESVRQNNLHSELLVRAEDAERARALLTAFVADAQKGELLTDDTEDEADSSS